MELINNNIFCRKFCIEFDTIVKRFIIFKNPETSFHSGYLATENDQVYSFNNQEQNSNSTNFFKVKNLCELNIVEFFISPVRMYARTKFNDIYFWDNKKFTEPSLYEYFKRKSVKIITISSGSNHTLFLTEKGALYGWGSNKNKQIQTSKDLNYASPIEMFNPINYEDQITYIYCYENNSFAITKNASVYFWGSNRWQLFVKTIDLNGYELQLLSKVKANKIVVNKEGVYYLWTNIIHRYKDNECFSNVQVSDLAVDQNDSIIFLSKDQIFKLDKNRSVITEYKSFNHYFLSTFGTTHSTFDYDKEHDQFECSAAVTDSYQDMASILAKDCPNLDKVKFNDEGYQSNPDEIPLPQKWSDLIKRVNVCEKIKDQTLDCFHSQRNFSKIMEFLEKCRKHFEDKAFEQEQIFFVSISFALKMIESKSFEFNFDLVESYFGFGITEILYRNYTQTDFSEVIKSASEFYGLTNESLFESIKLRYDLLENTVEIDGIFNKKEPRENSKNNHLSNENKIKMINNMAEDNKVKFKNLPAAVYHWYKHCVEDIFELKVQNDQDDSVFITPELYIEEANECLKSKDVKIDINQEGDLINVVAQFEKCEFYRKHTRNVEIGFNQKPYLINYYKIINSEN